MNDHSPLVSICCLTYNHAPYIRQCIDGFLMQKVNFNIEILIHDDASTDGTIDILREYEAIYPDIIFPIYEAENKYSNGYSGQMDFFNYRRARGKYIAYCEGDDYWTDPQKLQKQVDFMEANPEYSVCYTRYKRQLNTGQLVDDYCSKVLNGHADGIDIDVETYLKTWVTQGLTMVFRKNCLDFSWRRKAKYYRDFYEYYFLICKGKGRLMNFYGGVYRISGCGTYTSLNNYKSRELDMNVSEDLWRISGDQRVQKKYKLSFEYLISTKNLSKEQKCKSLWYCLLYLKNTGDIKTFLKNLNRTLFS